MISYLMETSPMWVGIWAIGLFGLSSILLATNCRITFGLVFFTALGILGIRFVDIVVPWVSENPLWVIGGVAAYIVTGVIWSLVRWRHIFLPRMLEKQQASKKAFFKTYGKNEKTESKWETDKAPTYRRERSANQNKARIVFWMSLWFISVLEYLITRALLDLLEMMYNFLHGVYVKIAKFFGAIYDRLGGVFQKSSDGLAKKYDV